MTTKKSVFALAALLLFACCIGEREETKPQVNYSITQKSETGSTYPSVYDLYYWDNYTPIEFLAELKAHPGKAVTVMPAPDDWIKKEHVVELMKYVDSKEPAAPVVSAASSYYPFNQTSAVGNEALFLIEGYRTARYPPALCSLYYFHPDADKVKAWWENTGKKGVIENATAIQLIKNKYRDLYDYPSQDGWPKTVETKSATDGLYVGFMQLGSGVPIISAECFFVGNDRTVRHTGTYNISQGMVRDISLETCGDSL